MGLGVGLILIAVGAILAFAVHVTTHGFNVNTIGFILLGVGILGSVLSLAFVELGRSRAIQPAHDRQRREGRVIGSVGAAAQVAPNRI